MMMHSFRVCPAFCGAYMVCRFDDHAHSAQFVEFAEFLIEMWAWHMARVKHATEAGGERLGQRLSETLATEKEQGMFGSLVTSQPVSLPRATSRVCTEVLGMRCFLLLSCLVREKKYSTEWTCLPISRDVHSTPGICGPDAVSDKCALWVLACVLRDHKHCI